MKTIQIDDDVHNYLIRNVREIGEDASAILRRLLKLPDNRTPNKLEATAPIASATSTHSKSPIEECISNSRFQAEADAVGRFLSALSWLYKKHQREFSKGLNLRGRSRHYFANSPDILEKSGNSVNPQKIPDSPYWVITNNDTPKKQRILWSVMRLLGYSSAEGYRLGDALE
jgi:negative modulator of initiation of replication